jgi:hypothetical protein
MRKVYGTVGEFDRPRAVLEAASLVRSAGFTRLEAYTPYSIEGLAEKVGLKRTGVPLITLIGGIVGASGGYFMMWYSSVIGFPLNVGGRPPHSWPSFIPITFELAVLCAALSAFIGMLFLNGLPQLYHPIFNTPHFTERNDSHGYLCVLSKDIRYDPERIAGILRQAGAQNIWEIRE